MPFPIICLTNTFPFRGEQFLRTELELVGTDNPIVLWTLMPPEPGSRPMLDRDAIEMHAFDSGKLSCLARAKAAFSSLTQLFRTGETRAALGKRGRVRNLLKALKFGYVSELRAKEIADWVRKSYGERPRLLFYSYWMYEAAYVSARLKGLFPGCRFVTRCHGYDVYETRHINGYLPYRRFILDRADAVFPISDDAKRYLSALYDGVYDHKTQVARLGSVRAFEPAKAEKTEGIIIASCSNLIPVKRVTRIPEALQDGRLDLEWYHFGEGETRSAVEKAAEKLPQSIGVHLMGYTPNREVQRFYATHPVTAFLNVSESEGIPVSIMEAQSYGIPVIATDVGGTSEIVRDGVNGVLLPKDFTDQDLLRAIEAVKENRETYSRNALVTWARMSDQGQLAREFYGHLIQLGQGPA